MDINNIFRGFFGFDRFPPSRYPHGFHGDEEDDSEGSDHFHDDFFGGVPNLFKQMEDMVNMFSTNSGFLDFPNLEMSSEEVNPRDVMLKEPSSSCEKPQCSGPSRSTESQTPGFRTVFSVGFPEISNHHPLVHESSPQNFSFRKSVSTKYVRSPDGVIEEHRSVTDNAGKTVTTVRKTMGDKTYQVTTESDKTGLIEKKEDFINIDENDVQNFEQDWNAARKPPVPQILFNPKEPISAPPGDAKYMSIFKKFFG